MRCRFARRPHPRFHAAADVEQDGDADGTRITAEIGDFARQVPVDDLEIAGGEIGDKAAAFIANDRADPNQVDARPECRDRRRCGVDLVLLGLGG
jgi:hypothetical protein